MENNAFSIIKGRYLITIWLLPFIYFPGVEYITYQLVGASSEWYWYDIIYYYYYHLFVAFCIFLLIFIGKPDWRSMFGGLPKNELIPSLKLTAFIFVFSISTLYFLFIPLSYVIPDFVQYWLIDIPPFIYTEQGIYPVFPNVLSFISIVILAPVLEEVVFRGLLLQRWQRKWDIKYAVLLSSFLFGIVHPDPVGAIAFGIAMCVLYLRTQSLWVPIICHSVNNLFVWIVTVSYALHDGPDHIYTLHQFQSEWWIGMLATVLSVFWMYQYLTKPKVKRVWSLPTV